MGLKFERDDSLDKMFDDLVILPDKKEEVDVSRFLKPEIKKQSRIRNDSTLFNCSFNSLPRFFFSFFGHRRKNNERIRFIKIQSFFND